jgi:DNA repair exonuclease SbcCD ATPase subunit
MIRLKAIRVNGIRGFKYLQDEKENPNPHLIKLDGKHMFLYGENGTGKSSLCDAIEWGLTGSLLESENRRINDKALLINKFCPTQKTPFVEFSYLENNNEKVFRRDAKGKRTSFDFEDEAQACLIESSRIEHFVIDTKSTKWERFSALLGFENLIDFENKLSRLKNHAIKKHDEIRERFNKVEVKDLSADIVEQEKIFYTEFKENWRDSINDGENSDQNKRYIDLKEIAIKIAKYIDANNKLIIVNSNINGIEIKLNGEWQESPTSGISKIIEAASNYFETIEDLEICPVCGNVIQFNETYARVKELRESLAKVISASKNLVDLKKEREFIQKDLFSLKQEIEDLFEKIYCEKIDRDLLKEKFIAFLESRRETIERDMEKLEKINSLKKQISNYQNKKRTLSEKESSLEELRRDLLISEKISDDISSFGEQYLKKYSEVIKKELQSICDGEITSIYNKINKSDEEIVEKFIIEPNIDKREIDFFIYMKGTSNTCPALDVLSTGHIRCLGFALLIARIKVKVKNLGFLIIDDPIYSIDHEHRYNLIQYLKELGDKYQLIITSSDRLFSDLIRNSFDNNSFVHYKTLIARQDGIIYFKIKRSNKQYIDEANSYLKLKDFRASSLYARLSLETKIFDIAKELKIRLPYDRIAKPSIRDVIRYGLIDSLVDKYPNYKDAIKNEFDELRKPRYFMTLLDGFPLDQEVHYPHENRITYSKQEIEEALSKIRQFNEFIESLKGTLP